MKFIKTKSEIKKTHSTGKKLFGSAWAIVETVAVVLLLRAFVVEAHAVPTGSMIPTIMPGEYLLSEKLSYRFGKPQIGDVVVFKYPLQPKVDYVKRCLATGGQTFEIRDRKPFVDGIEQPDSHAHFVNTLPPMPNLFGMSPADWQEAWESRDLFGQVQKRVAQRPDIVKSLYGFVAAYEARRVGMDVEFDSLRSIIDDIKPNAQTWDEYLRTALSRGFKQYLGDDFSSEKIAPVLDKALSYNLQQLVYYSIADNFNEITVPEGQIMCLGDNRDESYDSRFWGSVPLENVKGRPAMIYYSVKMAPPKPGKTPTIIDNILAIFASFLHPGDIRPARLFTLLF